MTRKSSERDPHLPVERRLTSDEAAQLLNKHTATVWRLGDRGLLTRYRSPISRGYIYDRDEVLALRESIAPAERRAS